RIHIARRNGVFADKISDRLGDLLFFLLVLQAPAGEAPFLARDLFVIALNPGALLGHVLIDLRLNLAVLFRLTRFQLIGRALLHAISATLWAALLPPTGVFPAFGALCGALAGSSTETM